MNDPVIFRRYGKLLIVIGVLQIKRPSGSSYEDYVIKLG